MVCLCKTPFLPGSCWGEEQHASLGPVSDPHGFVISIVSHQGSRFEVKELSAFRLQDVALISASSFHPDQFGKTNPIAGKMKSITAHPAMITALAPAGICVRIAQSLWDAIGLAVGLMPDGSMGFD